MSAHTYGQELTLALSISCHVLVKMRLSTSVLVQSAVCETVSRHHISHRIARFDVYDTHFHKDIQLLNKMRASSHMKHH